MAKDTSQKKQATTLVSPAGKEYSTTDAVEIVNLRARGYKVKQAETAKTPAKTDSK